MLRTEVSSDNAAQPFSSTATSSGTLPPAPPPPPPIKPQRGRAKTFDGRIRDTVLTRTVTTNSAPALHTDMESKQNSGIKPETTPKGNKPGKKVLKPIRKLFGTNKK